MQNSTPIIGSIVSFSIEDLIKKYGNELDLKLVAGEKGVGRLIHNPVVQLPGVSLTGFLDSYISDRLLIFGASEILYLAELDRPTCINRLRSILRDDTPAAFVARELDPPQELIDLCNQQAIPLFRSSMSALALLGKLNYHLAEEYAPTMSFLGTFVEVFGVGILLQGEDGIGKSEAALGLVDRGHRLIADESIVIKLKHKTYLEGTGADNTRHMIEIRGIGMIDVALLYGSVCVREHKNVDMLIELENWDNHKTYDRLGLEDQTTTMMGLHIPFYLLPVKPGRDVVLLIETLARNHRLKQMGIHSARQFSQRLSLAITRKQEELFEQQNRQ
jgi:HPr kinase/phosphorylase